MMDMNPEAQNAREAIQERSDKRQFARGCIWTFVVLVILFTGLATCAVVGP